MPSCYAARTGEQKHVPATGYAVRAKDSTGSRISFTVKAKRLNRAREVLARSSGAPGPSVVITWRSPWSWFLWSLIGLWLVASILLFDIGAWEAFHLEQVSATVTDNSPNDDNGRVCDLAWLEGNRAVGYEDLPCTVANEEGSEITVWWSSFWEDAHQDISSAAFVSVVGIPLGATVMLAIATPFLGLLLATPFRPVAEVLDKRQMRKAILDGPERPQTPRGTSEAAAQSASMEG